MTKQMGDAMDSSRDPARTGDRDGFALMAVLVLLFLLTAMLGPFLASMNDGQRDAENEAVLIGRSLGVEGIRDAFLGNIGRTQGTLDDTPGYDGIDEIAASRAGAPVLGGQDGQIYTSEVADLQARLFAPALPTQTWANLSGWYCYLTAELEKDEADRMEVNSTAGFDDQGYVWVRNELIRYERKVGNAFEGLTRGVNSGGDETIPDPYGPATKHGRSEGVVDARVRLLVTWQFDQGVKAGQGPRTRFKPWQTVDELARVGEAQYGVLPAEMLERWRPLLSFHSARPMGGAWGKPERVFNALVKGQTNLLVVRDGTAMPTGTIVRVRVGDELDHALVVAHDRGTARQTSVQLDSAMWLLLDRPVKLEATETQAYVEPLRPVPVNVNTAGVDVLATLFEALASDRVPGDAEAHVQDMYLSPPLDHGRARQIAQQLVDRRGPTEAEPWERPYKDLQDLFERVFDPSLPDAFLSNAEMLCVYRVIVNGQQGSLAQAAPACCFESAGLVRYRVAGEVLGGIGRSLGEYERRGIAYAQPGREVDVVAATQKDLDEWSRLARSSNLWISGPINTQMRLRRFFGQPPGEPADPTIAHLMPVLHGQQARFPSRAAGDGWIRPALAPAYRYSRLDYGQDFETSDDPDGLDLSRNKTPEIQVGLPGGAGGIGQAVAQGLARGRMERIPMMLEESGWGIGFGTNAWYKPRALGDACLFELANLDASDWENRIWLALEGDRVVLRAYDMAGQDPAPNVCQPETTAIEWEVPVAETAIAADTWVHAGVEYQGHRPGMAFATVDGVPKGKPKYLTWLTQDVPEVELPLNFSVLVQQDKGRFPEIFVESTEDFPPQGVLRIGDELFEYTAKTGSSFITAWADSRGGRLKRQWGDEFTPSRSQNDPMPGTVELPSHRAGSAVELYGFSSPVAKDSLVVPGKGGLVSETLDRWGVARATTAKDPISIGNFQLGKGIDEKYTGKLDLVAPTTGSSTGAKLPGFEKGEGYALLVQEASSWTLRRPNQLEETIRTGGVELVKYRGFDGSSIQIVERFLVAGPDQATLAQAGWFNSSGGGTVTAGRYVTDWAKGLGGANVDLNELPQLWLWVVPCSMAVRGLTLVDPIPRGHNEWLQVYPGDNDDHTEWVHYDTVLGDHVCRLRQRAMSNLLWSLTHSTAVQGHESTGGVWNNLPDGPISFTPVPRGGLKGIGQPDTDEDDPSYTARRAFRFRGDYATGTASHQQTRGSVVTPVHRITIFQRYPTEGRAGRLDRVCLITAGADGRPIKEWHTVQWSDWLFSAFDMADLDPDADPNGSGTRDTDGPQGCLVGLRDGTSLPMSGADFQGDRRGFDRFVKFPSGEMPMRLQNTALYGEARSGTPTRMTGIVDDIQGYFGMRTNQSSDGSDSAVLGTVGEPVDAGATTWTLRSGSNSSISVKIVVNGQVVLDTGGQRNIRGGGLAWVDGELIGVKSYDRQSGTLELCSAGRGLLGTMARPHDVGARVVFCESMPATYLQGQVSNDSDILQVADTNRLPRGFGSVLVDREVIHYSWTSGGQLIQMPRTSNPEEISGGKGILRGRYGTTPEAHEADAMAIAWPVRYLDLYHDRCDEPELCRFDFSLEAPDLFATRVGWQEEIPDAHLDVVMLARGDERTTFAAEPKGPGNGLWYFESPTDKDGQLGRWLGYQASRWDFRFHVKYGQGSFDPVTFTEPAWKRTASVRTFVFGYHGRTRVLEEQETLK
ncbi:MAG: hypothetical protein R3F30_12780 [Planctomycetota bacterium]